jgi:hypothetical protein
MNSDSAANTAAVRLARQKLPGNRLLPDCRVTELRTIIRFEAIVLKPELPVARKAGRSLFCLGVVPAAAASGKLLPKKKNPTASLVPAVGF